MYSLMIVEDELLARLALKNSIEWDKYSIKEVMEARDGAEALEKFRVRRPDILVVDINIPILNGIDLIKEIRKIDTHSKIIILSCLEDFTYAREAIKAGVSQYILKATMSLEEMEEAIQAVTEELHIENKEESLKEYTQPEEEFGQKETFFRRLLSGDKMDGLNQVIIKNSFVVAVFLVEFYRKEDSSLEELQHRVNFVKNIISSAVQSKYSCRVVDLSEQQYVAYIEWIEGRKEFSQDEVKELLENTVHLIKKYISAQVKIGVSDIGKNQNFVYDCYGMAVQRLGEIYFDNTRYSDVVKKAIEFAKNNFDKPITLNDAAENISISGNHLCMIFRKEYGMNYTDFVIGLRMDKAKLLLETSNCKLFEIAELCGFNDHTYFTRTFKKHIGISPQDYRKQWREHHLL